MKEQIYTLKDVKTGKPFKAFIDDSGSVVNIKNYLKNDQRKFFAVVMRCGHCVNKYSFIPIMFPIMASDSKSAAEIAMHLPRVKTSDNYDRPKHCLAVYPISYYEYIMLKEINDMDPFLTTNSTQFESREILLPQNIIFYEDGYCSKDLSRIKFSEEYEEDQVLERFFSPRIVGGDLIITPPIPQKDELMYEFFTQKMKKVNFCPETIHLFCSYYKLFGNFEPKEINLRQDNHHLIYKTKNEFNSLEIPEKIFKRWKKHPEEYEIYKQTQDPDKYIEYILSLPNQPKQSQISKFNERLKKYETRNLEKQPGEE